MHVERDSMVPSLQDGDAVLVIGSWLQSDGATPV